MPKLSWKKDIVLATQYGENMESVNLSLGLVQNTQY